MKTFALITTFFSAAAIVDAAPTDFTPPGGWDSVKYPVDVGANLHEYPAPAGGWDSIKYPADAGANLHEYPAPPGGWESVEYPPGTGMSSSASGLAGKIFTSTYHVAATPDQVVNNSNVATGGLAGSSGTFEFGVNGPLDLICWNIELRGFRGDYASPAKTATHIHEAAVMRSGPPRIAFPNPQGDGDIRVSRGCMTGPFTTGVTTNGKDSGDGFKVSQIEANPAAFFADVHSSLAVPGAMRGQLA